MKPLMLRINLSDRSYKIEEIPRDILNKYVGGRGLGSYLLYEFVPARANPLGEENHVIFTAGPASGSGLYFSPKSNLNTKSPATGLYLFTICSGTLAHKIKKAGFWAIDIAGISKSPVYLVVNNQKVEFKDATKFWGMKPVEAQEAMLGGLSPDKAATVAIGPAGEQLHKFAAIFSEGKLSRSFGRGGAGAVMGSKKLKGLVVAGDGEVEVGDKDKLDAVNREIARLVKTDFKEWADRWRRYETSADLEIMNAKGMIPTKNWQYGQFEGWQGIDKSTTPMGWPEKGHACGPFCLAPGCRFVEVKEGRFKGAYADVEWEAVYAFGANCGIDKMEAVIAANQICDDYGIDTISSGVTLGFAMECFERGLLTLKDTDGIDLRFGNAEAMVAMLEKLAKQEGFGKKLAMGTRWLSQQIKGSKDFAMEVKGLEMGGYECRGLNGQCISFAVDNRGGCHHGYGLPARREMFDGTRMDIKGKGEYVKKIAINSMLRDSLLVCLFVVLFNNDQILANALSALFGEPWTLERAREAGVRIMAQERLFNMREGISRKDDTLPGRLLKEPKPDGPTKGVVAPLNELLDDFYRIMGYDLATGNPPDLLLAQLGIEK